MASTTSRGMDSTNSGADQSTLTSCAPGSRAARAPNLDSNSTWSISNQVGDLDLQTTSTVSKTDINTLHEGKTICEHLLWPIKPYPSYGCWL